MVRNTGFTEQLIRTVLIVQNNLIGCGAELILNKKFPCNGSTIAG
jgi:hypothetical protein